MRASFEYLRPSSPLEAAAMKVEHGDRALFWAGGTDLVLLAADTVEQAIIEQCEKSHVIRGGRILARNRRDSELDLPAAAPA